MTSQTVFFILGFRAGQNILLLFHTLCKERLCAPLLMEYPRSSCAYRGDKRNYNLKTRPSARIHAACPGLPG
ncbi:hypothetical protein, partial [Klebsiella quasipneumoniae]|uniref:hypothetical protein n=1 Tax=Klebsiella quasipneumoniae TaxID=1463165 RepID=UPI001C3F2840